MNKTGKKGIYAGTVKRLLDLLFGVPAIVILSPVLGITALLVRIKLGSPVLFKQARPGKNEKVFQLYKFRSMTNATDASGRLLPDAKRLTNFGKMLRRTSIDELPELVNIIKGDMSFVGPRPLSVYYLPHYTKEQRRRHEVRPGLTGLAQVNGRNTLGWDERFAYDLRYADNVSFGLDLKILFRTVGKVTGGADVAVRGTTKIGDYGTYRIVQEGKNRTMKRDEMTWSEIGSFFWLDDKKLPEPTDEKIAWLPEGSDRVFTFSGRAAIEMVLRDLCLKDAPRRVFVPSYCCISMLQSFIDRDLRYEFYNVRLEDGAFVCDLPEVKKGDLVLIMSYFGLDTNRTKKDIARLHEQGAVVIEDITHSLFCESPSAAQSDYLVCSLRKWMEAPSGGVAVKRGGTFAVRPDQNSDHTVDEKIRAMREKYDYLQGRIAEKEGFLSTLSKCDNDLIHTDRMLQIDSISYAMLAKADVEEIKRKRKENAAVLMEGLKDLCAAGLTLPEYNMEKDTPLFLPVFLENEARESLRKHLIANGVYAPVHWPEVMGAEAGIRQNELSLLCDQRYGAGDMRFICKTIHEWFAAR